MRGDFKQSEYGKVISGQGYDLHSGFHKRLRGRSRCLQDLSHHR
ncbi:MAG: hypothetical protein WA705_05120 [Candidatus Ozemobacteraceae bacterium]